MQVQDRKSKSNHNHHNQEKIVHNPSLKNVKAGDLMSFIHYCKVHSVNGEKIKVSDLDSSMDFEVSGKDLIERSHTADQFSETVFVTKTKAAELLVSSYNRPLSVCFEKTDGTKRTLRGRLIHPEPLLGRSKVEDLDVDIKENRTRQVDHRTIEWLIVDGVKYIVK